MRAGEGGEDARLFCAELLRMYERYARRRGWSSTTLERHGESGTVRFAVLEVRGLGASVLCREGGAHSIQHLSQTRKRDRIHTSTATVTVFTGEHQPPPLVTAAGDIRIDTFRGSGKGGQHRNKTDSAVRVLHRPSGEMATVTSGRSQSQNRERALAVLHGRLQERAQLGARERTQVQRSRQTEAQRAKAIRVYDRVRDMVRTSSGDKVRGVRRILDGDLDALDS